MKEHELAPMQKKEKEEKNEKNKEEGTKEEKKPKCGLDRKVGIKGSQLSGGQKQRIAIARAIITEPEILMFDEATSALDSVVEAKVQKSIDGVMRNKTFLVIAHRISTIKDSDVIFVFKEGRVSEQGKY